MQCHTLDWILKQKRALTSEAPCSLEQIVDDITFQNTGVQLKWCNLYTTLGT